MEKTKMQGVSDGPHFRVVSRAMAGASVTYAKCASLDDARHYVLDSRAEGFRSWIQVTNDLGMTWTDCDDKGTPLPGLTCQKEPMASKLAGIVYDAGVDRITGEKLKGGE